MRKMADTLWYFLILLFGNHIKKHGSNFNQGFSFPSKSNLKYLFVPDTGLMRVLMSFAHKDLMSMNTPFFISKLNFSYDKYSVDKV